MLRDMIPIYDSLIGEVAMFVALNSGRPASADFCGPLPPYFVCHVPEERCRIGFQRHGDVDEFNDVQPPLAALVLRDETLWLSQSRRDLDLSQSPAFSFINESLPECYVAGVVQRIGHPCTLITRCSIYHNRLCYEYMALCC